MVISFSIHVSLFCFTSTAKPRDFKADARPKSRSSPCTVQSNSGPFQWHSKVPCHWRCCTLPWKCQGLAVGRLLLKPRPAPSMLAKSLLRKRTFMFFHSEVFIYYYYYISLYHNS